ncbi:MAG: hypothetical protein ACR2MS_09395, partial [Weeksellaceae bacterium]
MKKIELNTNPMKFIYSYSIFFILALLTFSSCTDDNEDFSDIKIGKEEGSLKEVLVNIGSERNILLSGGNGKYAVNVADSKVATVKISHDTLKIKGLYKGETFATLTSHDKKERLVIKVEPIDITISQNYIHLYPQA